MGRGFSVGHSKVGGRAKGTPNKKTETIGELFESLKFDVPTELIKALSDLGPSERAKILLELMQFLYPKRKAFDMRADVRTTTLEDLVAESYDA